MIQMGCKGIPSVAEFMDITEAKIGWDIVFFLSDQELLTSSEIMLKVTINAHYFMRQRGSVAQYSSLSEIGAVLWQRQLPTCRPPPIVSPIIQKTPDIVHHKRRKCSNKLAGRQLSDCGKKVIKIASSQLCVNNEDPLGYLIAAIKKTRNPYDSVCKAIFTGREIDDVFEPTYEKVSNDGRVITSVSTLPRKYITFSSEEKDAVLKIFDITREVILEIDGQHHAKINVHASLTTKDVLSSLAGFSELVPSSIERWNRNRGKVLKKTGHKINSDFEASVWGKLMICEHETKTVNLCCCFI